MIFIIGDVKHQISDSLLLQKQNCQLLSIKLLTVLFYHIRQLVFPEDIYLTVLRNWWLHTKFGKIYKKMHTKFVWHCICGCISMKLTSSCSAKERERITRKFTNRTVLSKKCIAPRLVAAIDMCQLINMRFCVYYWGSGT